MGRTWGPWGAYTGFEGGTFLGSLYCTQCLQEDESWYTLVVSDVHWVDPGLLGSVGES